MSTSTLEIGVLSDTHGLLRPEALHALREVDHILHLGDVGKPEILDTLRAIAPVTAIRGNIDRSGPCSRLPATEAVELGGHLLYLVHALEDLDLNPTAAGMGAILFGHSHKPSIETRQGVLYLNPGSAGPRRFSLPITLARLRIAPEGLHARIVPLLADHEPAPESWGETKPGS